MDNKQLKSEMDEWVKHFNHEMTLMNKSLGVIAKASKEIHVMKKHQMNDLSDILYLKEVVHRLEQENLSMKQQITFIHLTHKLEHSVKKLEQRMTEVKP